MVLQGRSWAYNAAQGVWHFVQRLRRPSFHTFKLLSFRLPKQAHSPMRRRRALFPTTCSCRHQYRYWYTDTPTTARPVPQELDEVASSPFPPLACTSQRTAIGIGVTSSHTHLS